MRQVLFSLVALLPLGLHAEPLLLAPTAPPGGRLYLPICTLIKEPTQRPSRQEEQRQTMAIGVSRKFMAKFYNECGIDIEFFTHEVRNASNIIRLTDRQNPGDKLIQEQAEAACNFPEKLGTRGAVQFIDQDNQLAARMCDSGTDTQGCSTLCKPVSFSIVNIKQSVYEFAKTALHEFFHSNCCQRACLNAQEDGTGTQFGFDIVIAKNDYSTDSCFADTNPTSSAATTQEKEDRAFSAKLNSEAETAFRTLDQELTRIKSSNPQAFQAACQTLAFGAKRDPGQSTYDPEKDFSKYYGGRELRHLAADNVREMGGQTGLPKNLLPSPLLGDNTLQNAVQQLNKSKSRNIGITSEERIDENSRELANELRKKAKEAMGIRNQRTLPQEEAPKAPVIPPDPGLGQNSTSNYIYQSPDQESSAPSRSLTNAPATGIVPPGDTSPAKQALPGTSNLTYGDKGGRNLLSDDTARPKGGKQGQNGAINLRGASGDSIQQRSEDLLQRKDRKYTPREIPLSPGGE